MHYIINARCYYCQVSSLNSSVFGLFASITKGRNQLILDKSVKSRNYFKYLLNYFIFQ